MLGTKTGREVHGLNSLKSSEKEVMFPGNSKLKVVKGFGDAELVDSWGFKYYLIECEEIV